MEKKREKNTSKGNKHNRSGAALLLFSDMRRNARRFPFLAPSIFLLCGRSASANVKPLVRFSDIVKLKESIARDTREKSEEMYLHLIRDCQPNLNLYTTTMLEVKKVNHTSLLTTMLADMQKEELPLPSIVFDSALSVYSKSKQVKNIINLINMQGPTEIKHATIRDVMIGLLKTNDISSVKAFETWLNEYREIEEEEYNAILFHLIEKGHNVAADALLLHMQQKHQNFSPKTYKAMIKGHIKNHNMDSAMQCFQNGVEIAEDRNTMLSSALLILRHSLKYGKSKKRRQRASELADDIMITLNTKTVAQLAMKIYTANDETEKVKAIHQQFEEGEELNGRQQILLVYALAKSGDFDATKEALLTYEDLFGISSRVCEGVIKLFAENGKLSEALFFLQTMPQPATITAFLILVEASARIKDKDTMTTIIALLREERPEGDLSGIYQRFVRGFVRADLLEETKSLLDRLNSGNVCVDTTMVNCLIRGYTKRDQISTATTLARTMHTRFGVSPNSETYGILIQGFISLGEIDSALKMLDEMKYSLEKPTFEPKLFNMILPILFEKNAFQEVKEIMRWMEEDLEVKPNRQTYFLLISNCFQRNLIPEATEYMFDLISSKKYPKNQKEERIVSDFKKKGISAATVRALARPSDSVLTKE